MQQRQPQFHDLSSGRPSSSSNALTHRRVSDINEAEQTQESIPLASSSSIPNSPEARYSPEVALPPAVETLAEERSSQAVGSTPPHSVANIDASLSNTSTAVSPLTRLQAKRERERHHDRRSRTHGHAHDSSNGGQGSSAAIAAGVKRRWTAALLPEHHTINLSMNLGNTVVEGMQDGEASAGEEVDEEESGQDIQQTHSGQRKLSTTNPSVGATQEDDMGMETDDTSYRIDGNSRPIKRTTRR